MSWILLALLGCSTDAPRPAPEHEPREPVLVGPPKFDEPRLAALYANLEEWAEQWATAEGAVRAPIERRQSTLRVEWTRGDAGSQETALPDSTVLVLAARVAPRTTNATQVCWWARNADATGLAARVDLCVDAEGVGSFEVFLYDGDATIELGVPASHSLGEIVVECPQLAGFDATLAHVDGYRGGPDALEKAAQADLDVLEARVRERLDAGDFSTCALTPTNPVLGAPVCTPGRPSPDDVRIQRSLLDTRVARTRTALKNPAWAALLEPLLPRLAEEQ